jgi:hypothetical protein
MTKPIVEIRAERGQEPPDYSRRPQIELLSSFFHDRPSKSAVKKCIDRIDEVGASFKERSRSVEDRRFARRILQIVEADPSALNRQERRNELRRMPLHFAVLKDRQKMIGPAPAGALS